MTLCIFQDGKIIVTGARTMEQINEAYHFLNKVLQENAKEVLRPMPASVAKLVATSATTSDSVAPATA